MATVKGPRMHLNVPDRKHRAHSKLPGEKVCLSLLVPKGGAFSECLDLHPMADSGPRWFLRTV